MDAKYIIRQGDRQFVRFEGLLLAAHEAGLKGINTTLLQPPGEGNGQTAIVQASVEVDRGTFTALGDASPASVARHLAPHVTRMAETRALARALRFALGVAAVAVEELGTDVADDEERPAARSTATTMAPTTAPAVRSTTPAPAKVAAPVPIKRVG